MRTDLFFKNEPSRLSAALLLSLIAHALLLSISIGGQTFGLPGFNFPWKEKRLGANDLLILLQPAQSPRSISAREPNGLSTSTPTAASKAPLSSAATSTTMSGPAIEHSELAPVLTPPPAPATTSIIIPAPPAEPVIATQKQPDPQATTIPITSIAQTATTQVNKAPSSNNEDSAPPKQIKQETQERASELIPLEREKQNTEQLKQAELIATAQRKNMQQEQVRQDSVRSEQIAKDEASQRELERQKVESQELARQEELRRETLQKEQTKKDEQAQQEAARQELARADASRAEASRKVVAQQEQTRQAQLEAARQEQLRQDAVRSEQAARNAAARKEAERLETERLELAHQEKLRREAAQKELARQTEQAQQDAARKELARADTARLETARRESERQDQIRQKQLETARQKQLQQEAARTEQTARNEAARKETEGAAAQRQELARQESLRRESLQKEQAKQERAEYETAREERLRAIGRQLNEEAAQRDAALKNPSRTPLPTVSNLRRGWLLGRADANADLVLYAEAMSRKIERNMAFDMVRELVKQPHVQPLVTVAIRADGSVEKVTFVVSSGVAAIDDAIRKVVASQAPYPAFSPALARQYDVIEIRRTWIFDVTIRLQ